MNVFDVCDVADDAAEKKSQLCMCRDAQKCTQWLDCSDYPSLPYEKVGIGKLRVVKIQHNTVQYSTVLPTDVDECSTVIKAGRDGQYSTF